MKYLILVLSLVLSFSAVAASVTISDTPEEDAQLAVAFGTHLDLKDGNGDPRDATSTEVDRAVYDWTWKVVYDEEVTAAEATAAAGVTRKDSR